jgi:mono/diheme cytochrome c family protein
MKTKLTILIIATLAVIGLGFSIVRAESQAPQRTTKEPVFTEAQAQRGAALIRTIGCANCHGDTLEGGPEETPALVGNSFVTEWQGQTLNDLAIKVSSMPPNSNRQGTPQENTDIMTLLLAINGYPMGDKELNPDPEVLRQIKIVLP